MGVIGRCKHSVSSVWIMHACTMLGGIACNCFFFFKQNAAYEFCSGDWSSDVCSSELARWEGGREGGKVRGSDL